MRRFKWFTPYKVGKTLAETLILSNLRYCIPVYSQLPKYLTRRLQRTQNTVAGYVLGMYAEESDFITTLGWLPVQEMMEFAIVKCTFLTLNDPKWPKYLRTTRLENKMMVERCDKNTFADQAHDIFNDLPKAIRVIKDMYIFFTNVKAFFHLLAIVDSSLFFLISHLCIEISI